MARTYPKPLKAGAIIEVNTASGWLRCKVIEPIRFLVEQIDAPENSEWKRFYVGSRGFRVIENP